jgi:hypothetical protein
VKLLNALSTILVGLDLWLILYGVLRISKYSKQSFPEQIFRATRVAVGIEIIILNIVQNYLNHMANFTDRRRILGELVEER